MQVPIELIVWMLAGNATFLSFCVHMLIRINGNVAKVCTAHEVANVKTRADLDQLQRHERRNELEIAEMRRHLRLNPSPRRHAEEGAI